MKILFVATVMSHFKAFHQPYMEWFQKRGWEVHAAAGEDAEFSFCDKKYLISIQRSPFHPSNIRALRELAGIIRREQYDFIHCHTPMGSVIGRLAAAISGKKGQKVLYTVHGFHFFDGAPLKNWLIYYPIERLLAHATDLLITINRQDYQRAKSFPAKRIAYVQGVGIDIGRFQNKDFVEGTADWRKQRRDEFGIKETDFMLLSVGELSERKNHMVVLEALAHMARTDVYYVICGEGALRKQLEQKANSLGIRDRVVFAGHRENIPEICHAADIFVFPSLQEGLSVALMEAMAAGLPVVASKIRGNTDLIMHKQNGYLVQPGRVQSYVMALEKLLQSKKRREYFGKAAAQSVQQYSLEHVLPKMASLYESCMPRDNFPIE